MILAPDFEISPRGTGARLNLLDAAMAELSQLRKAFRHTWQPNRLHNEECSICGLARDNEIHSGEASRAAA